MADGKMTKVAPTILQNVLQFILIISWWVSLSSACNFLAKISNATEIADLSTSHTCLKLRDLFAWFC